MKHFNVSYNTVYLISVIFIVRRKIRDSNIVFKDSFLVKVHSKVNLLKILHSMTHNVVEYVLYIKYTYKEDNYISTISPIVGFLC